MNAHTKTNFRLIFTFAICTFLVACSNVLATNAFANDECVSFDIPALVPSCEFYTDESSSGGGRLIEVVIPVSALVGCRTDQRVLEMIVQVRGLGTGLQVVDYSPQTQLYSEIEGSVSVENRQEKSNTIGINADGVAADIVKLNAKATHGRTTGSSERFQRIPEQKLLLASGTIERGKGAYFKFRHSPHTTLEGGHKISLKMRVPDSWRGGMLRVDCLATGKEKYLLGESDFQAGSASFVVATWLKGDIEAQKIVERYSALENTIKRYAQSRQGRMQRKRDEDPIGNMLGYHESRLPADWANRFTLYDTRSIQARIKPHLPVKMQKTTEQYLAFRRNVLLLSR